MTNLTTLLNELEQARYRNEGPLIATEEFDKNQTLIHNKILQLIQACRVMKEALDRSNYEVDYYDQKPHKLPELLDECRQALIRVDEICKGGGT